MCYIILATRQIAVSEMKLAYISNLRGNLMPRFLFENPR